MISLSQTPGDFISQRPLLSRVADSLYWMSRYVERAEHIARVMHITMNLLMDVGDLEPALQERQWRSLMALGGIPPAADHARARERVSRHLTFDEFNPSSILSCLSKARENARAVRSEISAEMWETINEMYWMVRSDETRQRYEDQPEGFFDAVLNGTMLFHGLTDQTLAHGQRYMFIRLATAIERADMTCRIIEGRLAAVGELDQTLETPIRTIQWMSTVRMCCSIEAYRRRHAGDFDPNKVVQFVLFTPDFPRSVRWSVEQALRAITGIRRLTTPDTLDPAERILGRLAARIAFVDEDEVNEDNVSEFLEEVRTQLAAADIAVQQTYFLK